jgi:hypothetical protein
MASQENPCCPRSSFAHGEHHRGNRPEVLALEPNADCPARAAGILSRLLSSRLFWWSAQFVAPASNPSGGQRQSGTAYQVTVSSTDPNAAPSLAATTQSTAQASGLSAAPASPSGSGLSGGAIAGIVIGCLVVVALIVVIIVVVVVLPQRKEAAKSTYEINT